MNDFNLLVTSISLNIHHMKNVLNECCVRGCNQNFPDWVDNEIYTYNNKHSLRNNKKCYGGKIHYTDSQSHDTTARIGRELYHFQFSRQVASPETFGYTLLI
jgi:hypothetical protein